MSDWRKYTDGAEEDEQEQGRKESARLRRPKMKNDRGRRIKGGKRIMSDQRKYTNGAEKEEQEQGRTRKKLKVDKAIK